MLFRYDLQTLKKKWPPWKIFIIQEFVDVFLESIVGLPPKRDIDFTIKLILGATPISKAPYCMITLELTELKMQLQEISDKKYIYPSASP